MTDLYDLTVAERARLTDVLTALPRQGWDADSLCTGWRVREVVAHICMTEKPWEEYAAAVEAAAGDVNVACDRMARADVERWSDAELLEIQRSRVPTRWTPGPGNQLGALSHEVIHGLDITIPLGLPGPAPEVVAATLDGGNPQALAFFGVDLSGLRLVATDGDLAVGSGPVEIGLTSAELLMTVTGRQPVPTAAAS